MVVEPMSNSQKLNSLVTQLVSASDPEKVKQLYAQWADSYESDLDSFGYVAPLIGVNLLSQRVSDKSALLHDAGCGTGLVGKLLRELGYARLHGSDFSTDMLNKARVANHYIELQTMDFAERLPIASNTYGAAISIGVYTKRFNEHFLAEMVRIIRPSAWFVFSCRELYFDEVMQCVSDMLRGKAVVKADIQYDDYMVGQNASAYYFSLQKNKRSAEQ